MEETRNNPIPFLILATGVGALLGKWWVGLIVGIAMTLIPGVALIALFINNLLNRLIVMVAMLIGFPFFLAYRRIRPVVTGRHSEDEPPVDLERHDLPRHGWGLVEQRAGQLAQFEPERRREAEWGDYATAPAAWHQYEEMLYEEALKIDAERRLASIRRERSH